MNFGALPSISLTAPSTGLYGRGINIQRPLRRNLLTDRFHGLHGAALGYHHQNNPNKCYRSQQEKRRNRNVGRKRKGSDDIGNRRQELPNPAKRAAPSPQVDGIVDEPEAKQKRQHERTGQLR